MLEEYFIYKFKMALFDNGETEDFLLFQPNYWMTLEVSGDITMDARIQYLCMLINVEVLCEFENICGKLVTVPTQT